MQNTGLAYVLFPNTEDVWHLGLYKKQYVQLLYY
jgi:hypothetical protein